MNDKFYLREAPAIPIITLAISAAATAASIKQANDQKKLMQKAEQRAAAEKAKAKAEMDAAAAKKKEEVEGKIKSTVGGAEARYGEGTLLTPTQDTTSIFK